MLRKKVHTFSFNSHRNCQIFMENFNFIFDTICIPYMFWKIIFHWNYDHDMPLCDTPPVSIHHYVIQLTMCSIKFCKIYQFGLPSCTKSTSENKSVVLVQATINIQHHIKLPINLLYLWVNARPLTFPFLNSALTFLGCTSNTELQDLRAALGASTCEGNNTN